MSAISGSVEGANTGWRQRGTWTVVPPDLNAVSVTPSDGIGVAQTFSATFSDDAGADDVKLVAVRFGAANVAAGVCTVQYNATTGMARIQSDAGTPGPWTAFGSGTLANSQCTLDLALSSADASGNNLTLQLHLAFAPAFGGAKTIYLRANSDLGPTTGWVTRGAWTVGGEMDAISIAPSNATGVTELFTAIFSDSLGAAADLTQASVRVGATNVAAGVCTVQYNAMTGQVRLHDDAGIAGPWTTFGSGTLVNTQCALDLAQSNAVAAGSVLTLNLRLTFKAAFLGARNIHMRANSRYGSTSGWQPRGTYTVGAAVTAGAVTPNSGTGMSPSFVLDYTNSAGVEADLKVARVRFRPPSGSGPQCVIDYDAMSNKVRIQQDSGLWSSFVPFGGPLPALANSRCTLDLTQGGAVRTGTSLSLTLRLTFDISFVGAKQIDMRANSNVGPTTGWVNRGTWMVLPPTTTIVPSSSTAVIDTLLIQLSNPATCCSNPMSLDNIVVFD
jgi:hypothetical protein